eukprot:12602161-Heterocapsa_arctica.AAC.1
MNPVGNFEDETKDENDYGHRHKRSKRNEDEHYAGDEEDLRTGIKANKQARKRAEENRMRLTQTKEGIILKHTWKVVNLRFQIR